MTLALPKDFDPDFIARIYDGMNLLARRHGVAIVGGETTSNPERLLISVALLGEVARDQMRPAFRGQGRGRAVCHRGPGRIAGGKTFGIRAAPGGGPLAGGAFFHSRHD